MMKKKNLWRQRFELKPSEDLSIGDIKITRSLKFKNKVYQSMNKRSTKF